MTIKLIGKSKLRVSFTNKLMTAYGGFSLLARLFDRLDLENAVTKMVPFSETSPNSTGVFAKVLKLGLTTMAGGDRFTHSVFLGDANEIYEQAFCVKKIPKSITAVTRFFARFNSWQNTEKLAKNLWEYTFDKIVPFSDIPEDYLNFDSSVVTRYGKQEGAKRGYNPKKKGRTSHHPILAFLNRSKFVVNLWNRSGNTCSANNSVAFAKQTLDRLKGKVSITGIHADSGFYRTDFIEFAESVNIEYVISAPMQRVLQTEIFKLSTWKEIDDGISVGEFMFQHKDEKWTKSRRYIVVRQQVRSLQDPPHGKTLSLFPDVDEKIFSYRYGLMITSSEQPPEILWRRYRLRADDENIIKENKQDFGLEGFSMKSFYATEAAMLIRILFYNIFNLFRTKMLTEPESKQTAKTLRMRYFVIPAVLGRDGKSPILRLGLRKQNLRQKFRYILAQIDCYFNNRIAFGLNPSTQSSDSSTIF